MSYDRMLLVLCLVISTIALILGAVAVGRENSSANVTYYEETENGLSAVDGGMNTKKSDPPVPLPLIKQANSIIRMQPGAKLTPPAATSHLKSIFTNGNINWVTFDGEQVASASATISGGNVQAMIKSVIKNKSHVENLSIGQTLQTSG